MKKLLIAMLALITALSVSLAACDKKKDDDNTPVDDDPDDEFVVRDDEKGDETTKGDGDDTTKTPSGTWVQKNDTVYVLTNCNIRSNNSTSSSKVGSAKLGDSFARLESNGKWSKITYNNSVAYILEALITEDAQAVSFVDRSSENLILHVKSNGNTESPLQTNLRNAPTSNADADSYVATITAANTANNEMKLLALSQNGSWAKVSYTGTIGSKTFNGTEELYVHWQYIQELNPNGSTSQLPG